MKKCSRSSSSDCRATKLAKRSLRELLQTFDHLLSDLANVSADPMETTHQLRVTSRRADVALRLFKAQFPRHRRHWLRRTLKAIRTAAGAVRDLDLLEQRWRPAHGDLATLVALEAAAWMHNRIQNQRLQARRQLLNWTRKSAIKRLRRRSKSLLQKKRRRRSQVVVSISLALSRLVQELKDSLPTSSASLLASHRTRIHARRLRYAVELLHPVLPEDMVAISAPLAMLQEQLGQINDDATAIRHLQESIDACSEYSVSELLRPLLQKSENTAAERLEKWAVGSSIESLAEALNRIPGELS